MYKRQRRHNRGATMVEYVLLIALIGVIAMGSMKFLGSTVSNKFNTLSANIATSN